MTQVVSGTWKISIKGLKEIIYSTFVKMIDMSTKYRNSNVGIYKFQKDCLTLPIYFHF